MYVVESHLNSINADRWPALLEIPKGLATAVKARRIEARLARICRQAGIQLQPADAAKMRIDHGAFFTRTARFGWLGFAESYMAQEWESGDLTTLIERLLSEGFDPGKGISTHFGPYDGGALPPDLVKLISHDGVSTFGGIFASAETTSRHIVETQGRRRPLHVTHLESPTVVERTDLLPAQRRAVNLLLDAAQVGRNTYVLEYPSSGGLVAYSAARRGAIVDCLTPDERHAMITQEFLTLAGVTSEVHVEMMQSVVPSHRSWLANYDAIVCVEQYEKLSEEDRQIFLKSMSRCLLPGHCMAIQTLVETPAMTPSARRSLDVVRAYLWPQLRYPSETEIRTAIEHTGCLSVSAERFFGEHYAQTLSLQTQKFSSLEREAAAEGFDSQFRRLWTFYQALIAALLRLGYLEAVQFTVTSQRRL